MPIKKPGRDIGESAHIIQLKAKSIKPKTPKEPVAPSSAEEELDTTHNDTGESTNDNETPSEYDEALLKLFPSLKEDRNKSGRNEPLTKNSTTEIAKQLVGQKAHFSALNLQKENKSDKRPPERLPAIEEVASLEQTTLSSTNEKELANWDDTESSSASIIAKKTNATKPKRKILRKVKEDKKKADSASKIARKNDSNSSVPSDSGNSADAESDN